MSFSFNPEQIEVFFEESFAERDELGAAVSIWQGETEIFAKQGGSVTKGEDQPGWQPDTLVPIWSATKGPAALTVLIALHEAGLSINDPVKTIWPELRAGSAGLTFGKLLAHRSGLAALDPDNRPLITQHSQVVEALEQQKPFWQPGFGHGYHPRTSGGLLEELVRRLCDGKKLGQVWREKVADPLAIDLFVGGLGKAEIDRLATIYPPSHLNPPEEQAAFYQALADKDSLPLLAFSSPTGMRGLSEINKIENLQSGVPALGGIASARGLAKFYAVLAMGGFWQGVQVIPKVVIESLSRPISNGDDYTLLLPTAFSAGFMMDPTDLQSGEKLRKHFGTSLRAFGQPGAGGSHAFADPENQVAFSYVMNQMEAGVLPNHKSLGIVARLYS